MTRCLMVCRMLAWAGVLLLSICPLTGAEWVVIQVVGMEPKVLVAAQIDDKTGMVTLRDRKGVALGAWQKAAIIARTPQFPDARDTWTPDQIRQQVGVLEAFVVQHAVTASQINPALEEARAYLKQEEQKAAALEAARKEALKKRIEGLLAVAVPERTPPPALADLESHVKEAQILLKEMPDEASRLEEHLKPWIEIRDAVVAEKQWFEDSWKTAQEVEIVQEKRRQEAIALAREKSAKMEISAVVITAEIMNKIQIGVVVSFALGIFSMLAFIFWKTHTTTTNGVVKVKHSGGIVELFKIIALLASLILVAAEGFYVYRLWYAAPGAVKLTAEPATSDNLSRMVFACAQPEGLKAADIPREVLLEAEALNKHFAKNVVFTNDQVAGALVRTAWAVKVTPDAVVIQENLQCGERTWTASYEILLKEDAAGTTFRTGRMTLDGLPVPNLLGGQLWNTFQSELLQWTKKTNLVNHYQFAGIDGEKLKFRLTVMPTIK